MNKKFLTAFITPKEWDVIGFKLKPYSVRMHINLCAIDSPYTSGQAPTAKDTLDFLKFCSSDCQSIIDIPSVTLYDSIAYLRLKYDPHFHVNTIKAIVNYIKEHSSGPDYRIATKTKSKTSTIVHNNGLPELLVLISTCMAKINLTEMEAMNMSIGRLCWYAAAVSAIEGADVRITPEDEDLVSETNGIIEWERAEAEKLRLAMVNGKIPRKRIKLTSE